MMERRIDLEVSAGERTTMVLSEPGDSTDKVVLLCHGFMSSNESSTNLDLTKRLLPKNIATCRFDFDGHGAQSRPLKEMLMTRCLNQVNAILLWLSEHGYSKIGLLGSSFGGLIAIHAAAQHPFISVVVLKCPVSNYPPLWRDRLGEAGMRIWEENNLLTFSSPDGRGRLEYDFYEDLLKYETYKDAATIKMPILIVHGDADKDVPISQSETLFDVLQCEKVFEQIEGADHPFSKDTDFEQMLCLLEEWFIQKFNKD